MTTIASLSSASLSAAWLSFAQTGTEAGTAPTAAPASAPVAAAVGQAISPLGGAPLNAAINPAIAGAPGTATATGLPAKPMNPMQALMFPIMMVLLFALMIGFSMFASRKEKKRRAELMGALKKGDRIMTNSGIMGNIDELHDNEVVLRLEDGRIRMNKSAIATIM